MTGSDHMQLARAMYGAYVSGDRAVVEEILAEDFEFFSPADVGIDRERYFERCWPNSARIDGFEFVRLAELGDEVLVTYVGTRRTGARSATPRC